MPKKIVCQAELLIFFKMTFPRANRMYYPSLSQNTLQVHRNSPLTQSHPTCWVSIFSLELFSQGAPCLARNTYCPYAPAQARESERKVELVYAGRGVHVFRGPGGAGWNRIEMACKCGHFRRTLDVGLQRVQ